MKTLTWRWHLRCYPAGTWPSAGGLCWCSETGPSSLDSPSAPTQHLALGVDGEGDKTTFRTREQNVLNYWWEAGAVRGRSAPAAGSTRCSRSHSSPPASGGSTLWRWSRWHSHQPLAGDLQCCRGRCRTRTSAGSISRCSSRSGPPHVWNGIRWNSFPCTVEDMQERHLLFDALGHHVVLADGAGGVEVQRDVELLGPHQGVAEPQGETGTQLLRFAGFVTQLRHLFFFTLFANRAPDSTVTLWWK